MSEPTNFDIESFQNDVLSTIQEVEKNSEPAAGFVPIPFSTITSLVVAISLISKKRSKEHNNTETSEAETKEVIGKAQKVVAKKDVRKILCPALQSVSNDAYDIAKIITPILVPLALAGTISIPLNPLFFATIALIIARMGIASICVENKKLPEVKSGS